jgi:DNA invertase Pin-like site-specific DNA recombinase
MGHLRGDLSPTHREVSPDQKHQLHGEIIRSGAVVDERHLPLKVHRQIALKVTREVKLNIGGSVYDPTDPIGKLLFTVLSMIAEFEADLARMRTREGMAIAKAKGRLRGKKPKLSPSQEAHLTELHRAGRHTTTELAELFNVARSTVYRAINRAAAE